MACRHNTACIQFVTQQNRTATIAQLRRRRTKRQSPARVINTNLDVRRGHTSNNALRAFYDQTTRQRAKPFNRDRTQCDLERLLRKSCVKRQIKRACRSGCNRLRNGFTQRVNTQRTYRIKSDRIAETDQRHSTAGLKRKAHRVIAALGNQNRQLSACQRETRT